MNNKMNNKCFFRFVIFCLCLMSCETNKTHSMYTIEDVTSFREILDSTLSDWDYWVLLLAANQNNVSVLEESIVMSSKNNALACYYMYERITRSFNKMHVPIDSFSNSIALMYLKRSADLGSEKSNRILSIKYKNGYGIEKDSCLSLYYKRRSDSLRSIRYYDLDGYKK